MCHLAVMLRHAGPLIGLDLPIAELEAAMMFGGHTNIVGSSDERDRRPKPEEFDTLMTRLERMSRCEPSTIPMHWITLGAPFLPCRLSEPTRIDVDDLGARGP